VNAVASKSALITGASKGIGRSVALKLAETGLTIFATARNVSELKNLQKEIEDRSGTCHFYSAELTDEVQLDRMIEEITSLELEIKVLVQNAGIALVGGVEKMPFSDWQKTININLSAPFMITQKCIPLLGKESHIFFINSVAGYQTFPEWSAYCASKWGLRAFADSLRQELNPKGIKVTSVYPSSVDTPMQDKIPYDWDRDKMLKSDDIAETLISCYQQPAHVQIKDIHLENLAGTF
jgi:NADP-dependent 3-hydroxy acid dehydrogenase YdfG